MLNPEAVLRATIPTSIDHNEFIDMYPNLYSLEIYVKSEMDLSFILKVKKLNELVLDFREIDMTEDYVEDRWNISSVIGHNSLLDLTIRNYKGNLDDFFRTLATKNRIIKLVFQYCEIEWPNFKVKCSGIEELTLENHTRQKLTSDILEIFPNMMELYLSEWIIEDFSIISDNNQRINYLFLASCSFNNFNGIEFCYKLVMMHIHFCDDIEYMFDMSKLNNDGYSIKPEYAVLLPSSIRVGYYNQ
jgi:hypothetical protein